MQIQDNRPTKFRHLKRFGLESFLAGFLLITPVLVTAQNDEPAAQQEETREPAAEKQESEPAAKEAEKPADTQAERPAPTTDNTDDPNRGSGRRQDREANNRPDRPAGNERPAEKIEPKEAAKYKLNINADNLQLIMHPQGNSRSTDLTVTQGDEFVTDIKMINKSEREVDRFRFVIDYNNSFLVPKVINDSPIVDLIDGKPTATVDRKLGQIIYDAKLKTPYSLEESTLVYITWEAQNPVIDSLIRFGRNREIGFSDVMFEGQSALGETQEAGDGTVSMNVTVIPSDPAEALMMQEEPQLYIGSNERIGGIEMSLVGPAEAPRVGDVFPIDIYLNNDAYSRFDGVSVLLKFDTDALEILDEDFDNWITLGHNISDGPYREKFPFNYHMANAVYPTRGMIEYRVGASQPDQLVGVSGVIATIHARALKPKSGAMVEFLFASREGQRTTEIKYLGQDVLGETHLSNDGVRNVRVKILPGLSTETASN